MWAAYKRGIFGDGFPAGMEPLDFYEAVCGRVAGLLQGGGDALVLLAATPKGRIPVGLAALTVHQGQAWPHVVWFPEASQRNRLECTLKFLLMAREKVNAVLVIQPADVDFFAHVCKYGVLRRIGTGRGWFGPSDAVLYETVRR